VWGDVAVQAVVDALSDDEWRVRAMAAKVCARHRLETAVPNLTELVDDPRSRVRKAAEHALTTVEPCCRALADRTASGQPAIDQTNPG
jgi:HEAT repeat protein